MARSKRILLVTPVWKGSLGFFCERALQQMEHETQVFDYRIVAYGSNAYQQKRAGTLQVLRNKVGVTWMNFKLRRAVKEFSPDIVLVLKGEIIEAHTIKNLVAQSGAAVALWYPDTSRPLLEWSKRHIVAAMRWYDVSFVCDPTHIPAAILPNIRRLEFLTFACDPDFHHPVTVNAEDRARFGGTACFIGNWQGTSSPRYQLLRDLAGQPVNIWGYGWHNSDLAVQGLNVMNEPVYGDDMLKVYSSNSIALNLSYDSYLNLRNFEVPACGPLLIATDIPHLADFFTPDKEIVTFTSSEELRTKFAFYAQRPELAAQIGRRGMERAHREHTFQQRMAELLTKIGKA